MVEAIRFTAKWCQPCKALAPIWDKLVERFQHDERVKFTVVDVDENPDYAQHFGVRSIPTILWFDTDREIDEGLTGRHSNGVPKLEDLIDSVEFRLKIAYGERKLLTETTTNENDV